ncbi:unnamed protein product [Oppiella nova]|uniref:Uncharacterized protein n=1 Tax=Oppiella nova TaxID=334625 RepID=A0A7R9L899_9ACAR|nr:unnamed protein product [Oppiella nova]CAG2159100.1 unnamed protein product [Oppiella nova]
MNEIQQKSSAKIEGELGDKNLDDKKDTDSVTSIQLDNESVKSTANSDKENISEKIDLNIKEETKENSEKEETDEYDKYFDRWESDSEQTVINSDIKLLTEDINNNFIETEDIGKDNAIIKRDSVEHEKSDLQIKAGDKNREVKQTNGKPNGVKTERKESIKSTSSSKAKSARSKQNTGVRERKTSQESKVRKKRDLAESKPLLSTSDLSLNKVTDNKNELKANSLKNSVSNQEINGTHIESDKQVIGNVSSEESIFDSALIIDSMEKEDSQMYSSLMDQIYASGESVSPSREHLDVMGECHKPGSRCGHKLHFKTIPANVGKIETGHIGSRVDSRRDNRYPDNTVRQHRVLRVRRERPSSDGYKSIDPNIITQTVEKSLRKYQLERKLFEELHDLKRFQIRSGRSNEILMVKRLIDKFRKDVKAPGMSDFSGSYTYKNYEYYLYDQLRKLSTSNQGKVALLNRSMSHENIQLIRNSNESITQSNPEMMQNTAGLDINQQNKDTNDTQSPDKDRNIESKQQLSQNAIIANTLHTESGESGTHDTEIMETIAISETNDKHRHETSNEIDSDSDLIKFDSTGLGLTLHNDSCESNQHSDVNADQTDQCIGDIVDIGDIEKHLKSDDIFRDLQNRSVEQNELIEHSIELSRNRKISQTISQDISENIINDCLNEIHQQLTQKEVKNLEESEDLSVDEIQDLQNGMDFFKQSNVEKTKSKISTKSSDSQTDRISVSEAKRDKVKYSSAKQSYRKECLKSVKDLEPTDRAKNRPQFKRLRTRIPNKRVINIPIDEIRERWKPIKESELKKLYILNSHKTDSQLKTQYILWYELNKTLRHSWDKTKSTFDTQIEKYIVENRNSLQRRRTLSDSKYRIERKLKEKKNKLYNEYLRTACAPTDGNLLGKPLLNFMAALKMITVTEP